MGGDRFEERCSQILRFFLTPNACHGLRGLFLSSLLEVVGKEDLSFSLNDTKVITEEATEDRKFIDITVVADDFVIAIENKIGASLYNPLKSYVGHIKRTYSTRSNHIFVLLSARPITDSAEIGKIKRYDYFYVNYRTLFDTIKKNLGTYALNADQSYLVFLFDFIRTAGKFIGCIFYLFYHDKPPHNIALRQGNGHIILNFCTESAYHRLCRRYSRRRSKTPAFQRFFWNMRSS